MAKAQSANDGPTLVERLTSWAVSIDAARLPDRALRQAALLILDSLGCGFAALDDPTARAALAYTNAMGGAPRCSAIGQAEKTSPSNATIANGVLVRTLDLNDYVVD